MLGSALAGSPRLRPFKIRLDSRLAALIVALAATLPYLPAARGYFLGDDFGLVQLFSNKPTLHVLTLFHRAWTEQIYGITPDELRPTLALSYQLDSLWGANNPLGYHLSSIALHLVNTLLVLTIARRVADLGLAASTFAAVLFAVLPIHPETVVWISGRADSIPTLCYLAAFLAYACWRRDGPARLYVASLVALFLGLFSKQSAITLLGLLLAYDLLVERRPIRRSLRCLRPYLPFAVLTLGYLILRIVLFGNAVREQLVTPAALSEFAIRQATYVKLLFAGSARLGAPLISPSQADAARLVTWTLLLLATGWTLVEARRAQLGRPGYLRGRLLFFALAWWLISIVPLVVTYETPRHLYQASVGPVIATALLLERGWSSRWRALAWGAAVLILLGSLIVLRPPLQQWRRVAEVSGKIQSDLAREIASAPVGSLVIVGAPLVGPSPVYHVWLRMWSLPFASGPPFLAPGLAERVELLAPPDVFCCPRDQWFAASRQAVDAWSARAERPPVIILRWDAASGVLSHRLPADDPALQSLVLGLTRASTWVDLCEHLDGLLDESIGQSCAH